MRTAQGSWKRSALFAAVAAAAATTVTLDLVAPAYAQAQEERRYLERPRNILEFLFGGAPVRRAAPPEPPANSRNRIRQRPGNAAPSRAASGSLPTAAPPIEIVEKKDDAKPLLVVGDFLAGGLADALVEAYAQNPNIRVVEKISGSSGFVRDDFYDWPTEITPVLDEVKPAAVVVMMGSNDRQDMRVGGTREQRRSEKWTAEYERRVGALVEAIRGRDIPLVWVGMPSFRPTGASADMLAFNDIYRQAAEEAGGQFVDIWEGFVDESGAFVSTGPDVNGQPVRLRSGDNGVNLTEAGRRKVAFYAEKSLERIFGSAAGQPGAVAGLPSAPGLGDPLRAPAAIDRTEPISLASPQLDAAAELLGASAVRPKADDVAAPPGASTSPAVSGQVEGETPATRSPPTVGERLSIDGIAPTAQPGRADDFGRATPGPADDQTTTSITE